MKPIARDAAAVAALAACALFLHRDGLFGGPAFYELDTRLFYYPLSQWVSQQLHAGSYPLWLPGIFTGYPLFADGELGLAYPAQVALLQVLQAAEAIVWLRVLNTFLAGLFTFLFLRTLRLEALPALGGSLVFAFGSFLTAQMHHENVIRSAIWLPAVLLCAERALGRGLLQTLLWTFLGGLCVALSAVGLHVQPVLMLGLALGWFCLFRALVPPRRGTRWTANAFLPLGVGLGIVVVGGGLAALQLVPLGEWALVSSRRGGVGYEFASAFALAPENLPSVLFPYFFRLADATTWWSLWQQWEVELYVGIPTLALVIVGLVLGRRAETLYFAMLGGLSLWIAMAHYAPLLNLHFYLWSVPGFSFLRAPGRFSYLVVFACAGLAAFGLQAMRQRRARWLVVLVGGVPAVAVLAALLATMPSLRDFLLADPERARSVVEATYLATRAQYPIDPGTVVDGLTTSLDVATPKTAWSLLLLLLTGLCFVVWIALGERRATLGQGLFVGLLAVDLLVFAGDFHPRAPLASLAPVLPPGVAPGQRVLLHDPGDLPALEPDQLLAVGTPHAQGYSSLPSQRHVEVDAATSSQPNLFDLWAAPYIIEPLDPTDLRVVDGVRFRAQHPLASGIGGTPPTVFNAPTGVSAATELRLIGTLSYAYEVPQGQTVATLNVDGTTIPIRAGIELAERAYDRPSLRGLVQHQKATVGLDFEEATPEGEDYTAHLYMARIPLPGPSPIGQLTFTATDPRVQVDLQGLGLVDFSGAVYSLDLANRAGLRRVGEGVLQNERALPRAYLLPRAQAFSPARHPGLTPTQLVTAPDADVHTSVLIENDPAVAADPSGSTPAIPATRVDDLGPNLVRVTADAAVPSYLILADFYQRGWTVSVDGQPAPLVIANALFRGVALDSGPHVVEFAFAPRSIQLGAALTILTALGTVVAIVATLLLSRGALIRSPRIER